MKAVKAKCKLERKKKNPYPGTALSIVYFYKYACLQKNFTDALSIPVLFSP